MSANDEGSIRPNVYTTPDGRVAIEQSTESVVLLSGDQIPLGPPVNGTVEVGGPEKLRMDDLVRRVLRANSTPEAAR